MKLRKKSHNRKRKEKHQTEYVNILDTRMSKKIYGCIVSKDPYQKKNVLEDSKRKMT